MIIAIMVAVFIVPASFHLYYYSTKRGEITPRFQIVFVKLVYTAALAAFAPLCSAYCSSKCALTFLATSTRIPIMQSTAIRPGMNPAAK